MADDLTIRLATEADESAIVAMGAEFYAATHYTAFAEYDEATARTLIRMMMDGVLVVAERGDRLVGMIGLVVTPFLFNAGRMAAHEVMWWVAPDAGGSGIGRALLNGAEAVARDRGATIMQMIHLENSPPAAAALYERSGFTRSETSYTKAL